MKVTRVIQPFTSTAPCLAPEAETASHRSLSLHLVPPLPEDLSTENVIGTRRDLIRIFIIPKPPLRLHHLNTIIGELHRQPRSHPSGPNHHTEDEQTQSPPSIQIGSKANLSKATVKLRPPNDRPSELAGELAEGHPKELVSLML
ncbi:hypothetical protein Bca101_064181 [Brassica carinata]